MNPLNGTSHAQGLRRAEFNVKGEHADHQTWWAGIFGLRFQTFSGITRKTPGTGTQSPLDGPPQAHPRTLWSQNTVCMSCAPCPPIRQVIRPVLALQGLGLSLIAIRMRA